MFVNIHVCNEPRFRNTGYGEMEFNAVKYREKERRG